MKKMEDAYGTKSELIRELREAVTALEGPRRLAHVSRRGDEGKYRSVKEHDQAMKALGERIARQVSWNGGLDTLPIAV